MRDRITVTMVEQAGAVRTLPDLLVGQSLMEAARAHGVAGILADCGGMAACATCHVYVPPGWAARVGAAGPDEAELLDMVGAGRRETSRLSCQIRLVPELDGLKVDVAPPY